MANKIYPKWKEALLQASSDSALTGTVKVALIDTGTYTYNDAHDMLDDISGVVGTAVTMTGKTYVGGVFDADDTVFSLVSGSTAEAIIIYIDTGSSATSRLVAFLDTGYTGLPVTPNGGNITVEWDADGIFGVGT